MAGAPPMIGLTQARLAVVLTIGLIILGAIWYGLSTEVYQRIWRDMVARAGGPMTFRLFLQPTIAAVAAIHDGIKDARLGRSPYFWVALHDQREFGSRRGRSDGASARRAALPDAPWSGRAARPLVVRALSPLGP